MKKLRKLAGKVIRTYGGFLCSVALVIATDISSGCRTLLYEPSVPKGFDEFAGKGTVKESLGNEE